MKKSVCSKHISFAIVIFALNLQVANCRRNPKSYLDSSNDQNDEEDQNLIPIPDHYLDKFDDTGDESEHDDYDYEDYDDLGKIENIFLLKHFMIFVIFGFMCDYILHN